MRVITLLLCALYIVGWGGGGDTTSSPKSEPSPTSEQIILLTGAQKPTETVADQTTRAAEIDGRADSLLFSTWFGERNDPTLPRFTFLANCTVTVCQIVNPQTRISITVRRSDFAGTVTGTSMEILSKHGITIIDGRGENIQASSLGATMNHSRFAVSTIAQSIGDTIATVYAGEVFGDLTSSRPENPATNDTASWQGLLVGTPTQGDDRGDALLGDARIVYQFNVDALNLRVTNIKNIDKNKSHSVEQLGFNNVSVAENGQFQQGSIANQVRGAFYGPESVEVAGTVEQSGVVGAFGAKRE